MISLLGGFALGFFSCLVLLYYLGTRRQREHGGTGPNSRTHLSEKVVPILRKG